MPDDPHVCFGCGWQIGSGQPHIHVPLDEWATTQGLPSLGLTGDGLLTFPFCGPCTEQAGRGWRLEAHEAATPPEETR
jgi:hypothetical protein